jgi:hypothetical protein
VLQREQVSYEILGMPAHSLAHATRHGAVRCVYLRKAEILTLHPLPSADRNHETRFFEPQIQCPKRGSPRVVRSLLSQEFDQQMISLKEDIRSGPASLKQTLSTALQIRFELFRAISSARDGARVCRSLCRGRGGAWSCRRFRMSMICGLNKKDTAKRCKSVIFQRQERQERTQPLLASTTSTRSSEDS